MIQYGTGWWEMTGLRDVSVSLAHGRVRKKIDAGRIQLLTINRCCSRLIKWLRATELESRAARASAMPPEREMSER